MKRSASKTTILKISVGIDISKPFFDAVSIKVLSIGESNPSASKRFQNTPAGFAQFGQWLRAHCTNALQVCRTCMEATGRYGDDLALWLHTNGFVVSVVNPKVIHDYAKVRSNRNKTDSLDAALIARFCLKEEPVRWSPPSQEIQSLRALLKCRADRQEARQRELNRLSSIITCPEVVDLTNQLIAQIDAQIDKLDAAIKLLVKQTPTFVEQKKLLVSIPGIASLTAMRLIAFDLLRFDDADAAVAMAGLNPSQGTSGISVHHKTRLSKRGHADLRKALYMPAVTALKYNPYVAALAKRLTADARHKMVIVGAAMRKLLRLAYGVLKSRTLFDPEFCPRSLKTT